MKKGRRLNYDDVVVDIDAVREQRRKAWSEFLDGFEDDATAVLALKGGEQE